MKLLAALVAGATLLGASAASSQTLQIGPGGPSIDFRSPEQQRRDEWRERREREAWRQERRTRAYDAGVTGSVRGRDCREVFVREQDEFGNTERRRELRCR